MKIIYFLFIALSFTLAKAQAPVIDHLEVDEAKNQLRIHGAFHSASGSVTIEDTSIQVLTWSDSLIVTKLPLARLDSTRNLVGRGSAGSVIVTDQNGISNKRSLSMFVLTIRNPLYFLYFNPHFSFYVTIDERYWYINWRTDIGSRGSNADTVIAFEASQSSYGDRSGNGFNTVIVPCKDTSEALDSSIFFAGKMNLKDGYIYFATAKMHVRNRGNKIPDTVLYQPRTIRFDSTGFLSGYTDTMSDPYGTWRDDRLYDQKILFPPAPKSSVRSDQELFDDIDARIEIGTSYPNLLVTMKNSEAVSFSIYDYLGRRYFHTPKEMLAIGEYSYPMNMEIPSTPLFIEITTAQQKIVRRLPVLLEK